MPLLGHPTRVPATSHRFACRPLPCPGGVRHGDDWLWTSLHLSPRPALLPPLVALGRLDRKVSTGRGNAVVLAASCGGASCAKQIAARSSPVLLLLLLLLPPRHRCHHFAATADGAVAAAAAAAATNAAALSVPVLSPLLPLQHPHLLPVWSPDRLGSVQGANRPWAADSALQQAATVNTLAVNKALQRTAAGRNCSTTWQAAAVPLPQAGAHLVRLSASSAAAASP